MQPRPFFLPLLALALTIALVSLAPATPLPAGATIALNGSTGVENPVWGGSSVNDGNLPFEVRNAADTVIFSGNLQNRVSKSRATGNLIFGPRIRDTAAPNGTARIVKVVFNGFGGHTLDVEYGTDGLGNVGPGMVTRSARPGDSLDFSFASAPIAATDESYFLQIVSETTAFSLSGSVVVHVEESPGGPVFTGRIANTAAPIFIDPNRITLESITRQDNGFITLCWTAAANVEYQVQRSADLENWTTIRTKFPKESPACESFFPLNSPSVEYYRVIIPDP